MKEKSESARCLMNFHAMIKNQFGKSLKKIRSDNRLDFFSEPVMFVKTMVSCERCLVLIHLNKMAG